MPDPACLQLATREHSQYLQIIRLDLSNTGFTLFSNLLQTGYKGNTYLRKEFVTTISEPPGVHGVMTAFSDYYEILQLSQNADQETIERVYRLLAKKYHPDSSHSGNVEKFRHLVDAYRVLSDPVQRAGYDATYDKERSERQQVFYVQLETNEPDEERMVQQGILSLLYSARRRDAVNPGVGIYEMERLLKTPEKHLEFHLWYLKEKGWIHRTENGQLAITASGVDEVLKNGKYKNGNYLLTSGPESQEDTQE